MKTVKLSTPFWLGDTVYGVLAFSVGEGNKIKYVVKPMEVTAVHYLPIACNYNRICFVCVTSTDNETGEEYFNTPEFFAKTKESAEELKREWERQLPEWKDDYWKDMFEKHKNDGVLLGGRDFLVEEDKTEHEIEAKDDKTAFIVSMDEDGNEIVQDADESEYLGDERSNGKNN